MLHGGRCARASVFGFCILRDGISFSGFCNKTSRKNSGLSLANVMLEFMLSKCWWKSSNFSLYSLWPDEDVFHVSLARNGLQVE